MFTSRELRPMPNRFRRLSSFHARRRDRRSSVSMRSRPIGSFRMRCGASRSAVSRCRIASASRSPPPCAQQRARSKHSAAVRSLLSSASRRRARARGARPRPSVPQLGTDRHPPHLHVGWAEVLPQPVLLPGEGGESLGLTQAILGGVRVLVLRREVRAHEVQHPERLGAESVSVPYRCQAASRRPALVIAPVGYRGGSSDSPTFRLSAAGLLAISDGTDETTGHSAKEA